jgi:PhnB protein
MAAIKSLPYAMDPSSFSLAPLLSVRNGKKAVEFYKEAFGAVETYRVEAPDGEVVARLSIGKSEFWVADEAPDHKNFSPETLGGGTIRLILSVEDPDAIFANALAKGATAVTRVEDNYGWRLGRIEDPFGHHWEIGKEL